MHCSLSTYSEVEVIPHTQVKVFTCIHTDVIRRIKIDIALPVHLINITARILNSHTPLCIIKEYFGATLRMYSFGRWVIPTLCRAVIMRPQYKWSFSIAILKIYHYLFAYLWDKIKSFTTTCIRLYHSYPRTELFAFLPKELYPYAPHSLWVVVIFNDSRLLLCFGECFCIIICRRAHHRDSLKTIFIVHTAMVV